MNSRCLTFPQTFAKFKFPFMLEATESCGVPQTSPALVQAMEILRIVLKLTFDLLTYCIILLIFIAIKNEF